MSLKKKRNFYKRYALDKSEFNFLLMGVVEASEVAKHSTREDCWIIIHGKAYDLTKFLPEHPGGAGVILKYAGKDATVRC